MSQTNSSGDSIAQHYHQRTKYDPETISQKSQGLNWEDQPIPFKEYKLGNTIDLKPYLSPDTPEQEWQNLSRFLLCSYGITARVPTLMGESFYLRSSPSAGGLYPAEVYLISQGSSLLKPGLYNYQCKTHSLVHYWENPVWESLQTACFNHPALNQTSVAIALTAVFYRSSWRYQDRAYRRICLDSGHLLGNLELAGAMYGYRPYLIGGFTDDRINELLYLDPEKEGTLAILPLVPYPKPDIPPPSPPSALPSESQTNYPPLPEGKLLEYLHQSTRIPDHSPPKADPTPLDLEDKYNFPFCLKVSTLSRPLNLGDLGTTPPRATDDTPSLENTILQRRSTRSYTGADLSLAELQALLDFTYQPQHYQEQFLDPTPDYFDLSLLETFIAVSGVSGLEEGCYYYAPRAQELRQIRFKNFRRELHYLCLGQDLGRDAAAIVFHTADLGKAVAKYGDRVYRYLHMDAGHLGQRLNLAAIHLGLGVSGIGGFFDDQVNEVLGIPVDEAVIYITTLGRPRRLG